MKAILKKSEAKEPFTFAFLNGDGKAILKSENYAARKSAVNGIESVKKNSQNDGRYEMKESKNGMYFFNLKAANGQIVATSALFKSDNEREQAITLVKNSCPSAMVEEL